MTKLSNFLFALIICSVALVARTEVINDNFTTTATMGLKFITIFPPITLEKVGDELVLELINSDPSKTASVTIDYIQYYTSGTSSNLSIKKSVAPHSSLKVSFDSGVVVNDLKHAIPTTLSKTRDSRISIESDIPISVLQHNYIRNGVGDSFLVLPERMFGQNFVLSLPATCSKQIVYFILASNQSSANIYFTAYALDATFLEHTITSARNSSQLYYTNINQASTIYVTSTANFQVLIALQELHLPDAPPNQHLDFASTMPAANPESVYYHGYINDSNSDLHPTSLHMNSTDFYTITAAYKFSEIFNATIFSTINAPTNWLIHAAQLQMMTKLSYKVYGVIATAQSKVSAVTILHFGSTAQTGAFLNTIPALSQYVTGLIGFVVRSDSDVITVLGDATTNKTCKIDGKLLSFELASFGNETENWDSIYYAHTSLPTGYHSMHSYGNYIVIVNGKTQANTAYAYTVAMNEHQFPFDANFVPTAPSVTTAKPRNTASLMYSMCATVLTLIIFMFAH